MSSKDCSICSNYDNGCTSNIHPNICSKFVRKTKKIVDLKDVSLKALRAEVARKEEIGRLKYEAEKQKKRDLWFKHIDVLIELFPEHDCTSCNDGNLTNSCGRCSRCTLLETKKSNYWDEDFELDISIHKNKKRR